MIMMRCAKQNIRPFPPQNPAASASSVKSANLLRLTLALLLLGFCHIESSAAPDPSSEEAEASAPELTEAFRDMSPPVSPVQMRSEIGRQGFLAIGLFALTGIFVIRKLDVLASLNRKFNPWALTPATAAGLSAEAGAQDEAFSEFLGRFKTDPSELSTAAPQLVSPTTESDPIKDFFGAAPKRLGELRMVLQHIDRAWDTESRQKALVSLGDEISALKDAADFPELLQVWQFASALEGLLKQLTDKAHNFTSSTLRTVTNGVALLCELCEPGVRADLLTNPPLRLLAVDDELISRKAVSFALQKT